MIYKLNSPWKDQAFLALLTAYERELQLVEPSYPCGQTITFLDVQGMQTFVDVENESYAGFIVLEIRGDECEIHELYVRPANRNAAIAIALLEEAFCSGFRLVFNIFKKNVRALALAECLLRRRGAEATLSDREVWGTYAVHYEMKLNKLDARDGS
ncbi:MAG: hypothetical protein PHW60_03600 [Kiritimatiellae bacterium]|nr:hypothetical protein [Kiritimatiellia bacterium]